MSRSSTKPGNGTDSKAGSLKRPGHLNSITESLRERAEQTRRETEKLLQAEFSGLSKSLSGYVKNELNTITGDINSELNTIKSDLNTATEQINTELQKLKQKRRGELNTIKSDLNTATEQINTELQKLKQKRRLWPRLLLICLIICASSVGTVTLQDWLIRRNLSAKQTQLTQLNETLDSAEAKGIEIFDSKGSTFISLRPGLQFQTGFTVSNGAAQAAKIVRN